MGPVEFTSADSIKLLKRKVWKIKGIIFYNHDEADLENVIEKVKRIGQVPSGYHYPELNRKDTIDP